MAIKELIEARWKAIICGLIALVLVEVSAATYDLFKSTVNTSNMQQMPQFLQQQMQQMTSSYDLYVWGNWFAKNGPEIMVIVAIVLGAGLIAGEVNKGTIFFLLGKPISRERVLLIKYAVSALIRHKRRRIARDGSNCRTSTGYRWSGDFHTLVVVGSVIWARSGTHVLGSVQGRIVAVDLRACHHPAHSYSQLYPQLGRLEFD
jgi:hypothetical protein